MNSSHTSKFVLNGITLACLFVAFLLARSATSQPDSTTENPRATLVKVQPTGYQARTVTKESTTGQELFVKLNCIACHSIHNTGGTLGPMLDGVGGRRTPEYLNVRITNTAAAQLRFQALSGVAAERDNHIRISESSAVPIASFLLTLPEPAGGFIVQEHSRLPAEPAIINKHFVAAPVTANSTRGEKLFSNYGCAACHSVNRIGGWLAPDLNGIAGRRSRQYMTAHITDARARAQEGAHSGESLSVMPRLVANPEEIERIVDFLQTLPNPPAEISH